MFVFRAVFCLFAVGVLCASPASADINAGLNNNNQQLTHQTNPLGPSPGYGGSSDPCASVSAISGGCSDTSPKIVTCNSPCEKHQSCSSCPSGKSRTQQTDACGNTYFICAKSFNINPGDNILPTNACGAKCNDCTQQDWKKVETGVQMQTTFKCDLDTGCDCKYTYNYRCDTGYYGDPISTTDTDSIEIKCDRCPDIKGVFGTTDGPGKTNKTECYMPSNITFTDGIGTYSFATTCKATATATGN